MSGQGSERVHVVQSLYRSLGVEHPSREARLQKGRKVAYFPATPAPTISAVSASVFVIGAPAWKIAGHVKFS